MDRRAQLEELDSLKSIFYSEEFQVVENSHQDNKLQAIFWAFLNLPDNYTVKYLKNLDSTEPSYLRVNHLPPIELRLILPEDYPSRRPPEFIISCPWLSKTKISLLCEKLDDIWWESEPVEIIYSWCDFLKNDTLKFLRCENELDITELCVDNLSFMQKLEDNDGEELWKERNEDQSRQNRTFGNYNQTSSDSENNPSNSSPLLEVENLNRSQKRSDRRFDERAVSNLNLRTSAIKLIENYNTEREEVEFSRNFYSCNICFSDKLGRDCTQFKGCKHVFCINCIRSYFTTRIKDGTVELIKCPEEKCTSEALPSQVKEIVSEEMFAKYDSVLLSKALDTISDIIFCPRKICQYPFSWDPEENFASCPNCELVFCVSCKRVYHGVEPCQIKLEEVKKLIEEYQNASNEVRQQMETKYTKKRLETLVNNNKAEIWIRENSKPCPRCETAIEKSDGCNKMLCWKCNAHFCWLCCGILDSKNPYAHFNDPLSRCANKLFYLVDELDDDWDWMEDND